ncbi:MAG: HDOD domain-containing protein, partial [Desulfobacterales bacterium]|nr:HDOD domain-containing protein [Desulfobacterales bacterium]
MIDQESIKKIETKIKGIPLIDAAIFEVLSLLDKPETNFQRIVEKLSPEISAKFLKMANSAYYGRNVRTVEYAIRVLGFKAMKQILTTSTIIDHFANKADLKGFNFEKFQKHAQFCAAVSRVLGEMLGYEALEDLFTAAMLHNIGKLVIVVYLGNEYKEIEALKKSQGISSREAEKRVL